jgi:hypothetical protein
VEQQQTKMAPLSAEIELVLYNRTLPVAAARRPVPSLVDDNNAHWHFPTDDDDEDALQMGGASERERRD